MSTKELTRDNLDQTLSDNEIVLIDWWADWCGPCRAFAPVYEAVSEKHDDVGTVLEVRVPAHAIGEFQPFAQ